MICAKTPCTAEQLSGMGESELCVCLDIHKNDESSSVVLNSTT